MDAVLCNEVFSKINFHFCSVILFCFWRRCALYWSTDVYRFYIAPNELNLPSLFVYVGSQCMPEIAFLTSGYLEHICINASMCITLEHMHK